MEESSEKAVNEADKCIAIGAGIGALGLAVGTVVGATCPLCYVVAPGLIGAGLVHRVRAKLRNRKITKDQYLKIRDKSYKSKARS